MIAPGQETLQGEVFVSISDRSLAYRWLHAIVRFVRTKPLGTFGAFLVLLMLFLAIFANQVAPFGYDHREILQRLQGPSARHLMGTDELGRDILSRIIYGARIAAFVGFGTVLLSMLLSSLIGTVSGYFSGIVDMIIQRIMDIFISFPPLILLLTVAAVIGTPTAPLRWGPFTLAPAYQRVVQMIIVLGVLFSFPASRIIRGATLTVRNNLYIEGAQTIGASSTRILLRYILPNVFPTIIVIASLQLATAILVEATLSFLALGIPPPVPSWGSMLSGIARDKLRQDPWLTIWPGVAISLAVYGFNMFGDALRDVLDPRLRGTR